MCTANCISRHPGSIRTTEHADLLEGAFTQFVFMMLQAGVPLQAINIFVII